MGLLLRRLTRRSAAFAHSPAVLITFSAYLFAVTTLCVASITEFTDPAAEFSYNHVGYETQLTGDGVSGRLENIYSSCLWQLIGLLLMAVSQSVLRGVTFGDIDMVGEVTGMTEQARKEDYGRNIAAAIVEGGAVVSAGLVSAANIGGAPKGWGEGKIVKLSRFVAVRLANPKSITISDILSTLLFFVLSQLGFIIYTKVFDVFFIHGTLQQALQKPLDEEHEIPMPHGAPALKRGNVAVAISYACTMVSFAMLISNAVYKSYELASFGVWFVLGGFLQLLFREMLDRAIAPGRDLDDALDQQMNWGFACVIGAMQLSVSRVLVSLMEDTCQGFQ